MKTIEFEGKKYEVEDWVNFVAREANHDILKFELSPTVSGRYWHAEKGRWGFVDRKRSSWQDSLTKV